MSFKKDFQQAVQAIQAAYAPDASLVTETKNPLDIFEAREDAATRLRQLFDYYRTLLTLDTLTPEERTEIMDVLPVRTDFAVTHEYHDANEAIRKYNEAVRAGETIASGPYTDQGDLDLTSSAGKLQGELERTSHDQGHRLLAIYDLTAAILDDMRFGKRGLTKDAVLAFITTEPLFDMVPEAELIASRYLFGRLRHLTGTRALYTVLKHREEEFQAEMVSDCVAVGENEKAESTTTPTTTAVDELTPSEQVIFRRAQNVYAGQDVPSAPELRQYFRCKRAVADKVYAALMVVAVVED